MALSHDELLLIGRAAANEVIGNAEDVDVAASIDGEGHPSYYFELRLKQTADQARATLLRIRLRQKVRDLLVAQNDESYPYVRIVGEPL